LIGQSALDEQYSLNVMFKWVFPIKCM